MVFVANHANANANANATSFSTDAAVIDMADGHAAGKYEVGGAHGKAVKTTAPKTQVPALTGELTPELVPVSRRSGDTLKELGPGLTMKTTM